MHIIGTAGHVDHGKSSLVAALTGTNPDRWIEEQLRGMTLDLGFAHLRFDDGTEAGIIDVPGHARFLHNMLAGAAGMEVLLLVIAANEGVMPQTIEHLQILRYLNVQRVVVALTKIDLIAPDEADNVASAIRRSLEGTIAEDAPFFAVSTVTGAHLDPLKTGLRAQLASLGPRDPQAPAYLPIDRVFSLPGRGTIVTGTLMQGRIAVGDTLSLQPSGKSARVRSIQVFGATKDAAFGGTRVALNIPGIEKGEIARGEVVADPQLRARERFVVDFSPLPDALGIVRRRTHVRAHIGSAEILGTLVLSAAPERAEAMRGELFLRQPVVAFPGVRFVVRRVSPKTVLGGGSIAAADALGAAAGDELGETEALVRNLLERAELTPSDGASIAFAANIREDVAQHALDALVARGDAVRIARPLAYVHASAAQRLREAVVAELQRLHEREPWTMGATSIALGRALAIAEPLLVRMLAAYTDEGALAHRAGYYSTTDHQPRLSNEQRAFFDQHRAANPSNPHLPCDFAAVAAAVKQSPIEGISKAFDTLFARGALVKVGDALYRGPQIAAMHAKIDAFIAANGRMSMAEFRDLLSTSRKYAVPLLEWFDSRGITVRSGDYRMMRARTIQTKAPS